MREKWNQTMAILLVLMANGCATIGSLCRSPDGPQAKYYRVREVYAGTQFNYDRLQEPMSWLQFVPKPVANVVRDVQLGSDLVLCSMLDTVGLPYTYGRTLFRTDDKPQPTAAASPPVGQQKVDGQ